MGMYDQLRCDMPLPGSNALPADTVYQTKSFDDPALEDHRITDKGRLVLEEWDWWPPHKDGCASNDLEEGECFIWQPCDCGAGDNQVYRRIAAPKDMRWDGELEFYTGRHKDETKVMGWPRDWQWWEYRAKFTGGVCVEIKCLSDGLNRFERGEA